MKNNKTNTGCSYLCIWYLVSRMKNLNTDTGCCVNRWVERTNEVRSNYLLLLPRIIVQELKVGFGWFVRPTMISENRNQQDFPSPYRNPRAVPSAVIGHFWTLPTRERTCFSHTALDRRHESSPRRAWIRTKLGGFMLH